MAARPYVAFNFAAVALKSRQDEAQHEHADADIEEVRPGRVAHRRFDEAEADKNETDEDEDEGDPGAQGQPMMRPALDDAGASDGGDGSLGRA